jgi:type III secretion protein U
VSGDKTEQPTPKRLREARRRGEVAVSRELTSAAALAGGLAALAVTGPRLAGSLARGLEVAMASPAADLDAPGALRAAAWSVLTLALPPLVAAAAAAALAGALQTRFNLAPAALAPRLDRVDPFRGLRRLLSPAQLVSSVVGLGKAAVLAAVAVGWLRASAGPLAALARAEPGALWAAAPLLAGLAWRLAGAAVVLGLVELALARRRHLRALRMTRDEIRREHKEDEGDPSHRAERRRRHRALLEAGPVARATVVLVNPTHVAVALRHDRAEGGAPVVVAKGAGRAAAAIRSAARRAAVPIVRDVPLARALHRLAELGDEIPEELYEAAAAVLARLYGLDEVNP